jgi:methyl-accepting chemotaxis protein
LPTRPPASIARDVDGVSAIAGETSAGGRRTQDSANELTRMSGELGELVRQFRI